MRKSNRIAVILTIVNAVVIGGCAVLFLSQDRQGPEITFSDNEAVYSENMNQKELLVGVAATDRKDGDITERIVVEKIVTDSEQNQAVVFYAVTDMTGNVTKASRVFPAVLGEDVLSEDGNAGIAQALAEDDTTKAEATPSPEPTPLPTESPEPSASPSPSATPDREREEALRRQQEEEQQAADAAAEEAARLAAEAALAKAGNPVIHLKNSVINATVGNSPAWIDAIGGLSDDKDSYETLFHHLKTSKYDKNQPGDHQVILTTTDSDGNVSDPVSVIVHVK